MGARRAAPEPDFGVVECIAHWKSLEIPPNSPVFGLGKDPDFQNFPLRGRTKFSAARSDLGIGGAFGATARAGSADARTFFDQSGK